MRSKTVYVAYDGEEFEDINDCIRHEQRAINMMDDLISCVTFLDEDEKLMSFTNEIEIGARIDDFDAVWSNSTYMIITKDVPSRVIAFICEGCGIWMPKEKGKYYYDFESGKWEHYKAD